MNQRKIAGRKSHEIRTFPPRARQMVLSAADPRRLECAPFDPSARTVHQGELRLFGDTRAEMRVALRSSFEGKPDDSGQTWFFAKPAPLPGESIVKCWAECMGKHGAEVQKKWFLMKNLRKT